MPERNHPACPGGDPVAGAIETLLLEMAAEGYGTFQLRDLDGATQVSFAHLEAAAMNRDIALVKLASLMMDDATYCPRLVQMLRGRLDPANSN